MSVPSISQRAKTRLRLQTLEWQNNLRASQLIRQVNRHTQLDRNEKPVVVFNASTRLTNISQNAAFAFLAGCGLQLAGIPVINFACGGGLGRCVQGTNRDQPGDPAPCASCRAQSGWLHANAPTVWFKEHGPVSGMAAELDGLDVAALSGFEYQGMPLGEMVVPSLRWVLRRHHFSDDEPTRFLLREYIQSAYRLAQAFGSLLDQVEPQAALIFNGLMYPEAAARWAARQRGVRVITHEVGMQPFTAFFTEGEATAYPIEIPPDFHLSPEQNARLDAYLEQRFQGNFSMAGIQFWPQMRGLDEAFLQRLASFRQVVPVFTNVIFDTSQVHANRVFPHMFAWLDQVRDIILARPDTLFVIRAHPDEMRPGKESRESVADWFRRSGLEGQPNAVFIPSDQFLSSYDLIQRAKFVMVYNSSIGLEAALLGAAVLSGGKARYTQYPTVFFPPTPEEHQEQAEAFLEDERIDVPGEFVENARRFLYYQLFRTSLPFGEFMDKHPWPGFVLLRKIHWQSLTVENSPAMRVIVDGVRQGGPFFVPE